MCYIISICVYVYGKYSWKENQWFNLTNDSTCALKVQEPTPFPIHVPCHCSGKKYRHTLMLKTGVASFQQKAFREMTLNTWTGHFVLIHSCYNIVLNHGTSRDQSVWEPGTALGRRRDLRGHRVDQGGRQPLLGPVAVEPPLQKRQPHLQTVSADVQHWRKVLGWLQVVLVVYK